MSDKNPPNPWDDDAPENKKEENKKPKKRVSGHQAPNVEDLVQRFQETFQEKPKGRGRRKGAGGSDGGQIPGAIPPKKLLTLGILGLLVFWLISGFYRVQEGEHAVVLFLGKLDRDVKTSGLHYHLPAPFEEVIVKKTSVINIIDSRRIKRDRSFLGLGLSLKNRSAVRSDMNERSDQSLVLTGDENMVHALYKVRWRIKNLSDYLFIARNPDETILAAAESALREVMGQTTSRLSLTEGRLDISRKTVALLQKILDSYQMGIEILGFELQRVVPPLQVEEAFNDMQASIVDAERIKREAEAYGNKIIPVARGQAERVKNEAEAYAAELVEVAKGKAARFGEILNAYRLNAKLAKRKMYYHTMQKVLKKAKNKTIFDAKTGQNLVPYLNLEKKLQKR